MCFSSACLLLFPRGEKYFSMEFLKIFFSLFTQKPVCFMLHLTYAFAPKSIIFVLFLMPVKHNETWAGLWHGVSFFIIHSLVIDNDTYYAVPHL